MSDEDDAMNSALDELDADSNDDDDSSSSSSGSSSSSSDSESDGEKETEDDNSKKTNERKSSIETTPTFGPNNGLSSRTSDAKDRATAEPLNVNSTRAAARFREQVSAEPGLMALGTKKRDRRTIEMIQRDLQSKRGKTGKSSSEKKPTVVVKKNIVRPMASPPKTSPAMSPESGTEMERIHLGISKNAAALQNRGKSNNSARSRLEKKLLGRPTSRSTGTVPAKGQPAKKTGTTSSTTLTIAPMTANGSSSRSVGSSGSENGSPGVEHEATTAPQAVQPSGRVIRAVLRALLRYGDLTDVHLFPHQDHYQPFADDFKLPSFIIRSNLNTQYKQSEDQLLKLACEISEMVQRAIEERKDNIKYMEVEIKPSQVIERLYENLKLRVAVQRALKDAGFSSSRKGSNTVYSLVAKHQDVTMLGIGDAQAWSWAEKEHDWNGRKDTVLLLGVYLHGFGAWEEILNDDQLSMQKQRALKGERLKKRAENLLKRLPAPTSAGEPSLVTMATSLGGGGQNSAPSLGAQISAIANGASVKGGRMQRAAERAAAARQDNGSSSSHRQTDDSNTRKGGEQPSSSTSKSSVTSPPRVPITVAPNVVGAITPSKTESPEVTSKSKHNSHKRSSPHDQEDNERKRKHSKSSKSKKVRELSLEEMMEKWDPAKRLKEIRQVLKKMNVMSDWSKQRADEVVVEKVYQYIATIGETIDKIIHQTVHETKESVNWTSSQWDELCTVLWTYAAGFTPFQPLVLERLYDDICRDGEQLRRDKRQSKSS